MASMLSRPLTTMTAQYKNSTTAYPTLRTAAPTKPKPELKEAKTPLTRRVYLYADETGNLDYEGSPNPQGGGASTYFGFGTATSRQTTTERTYSEAYTSEQKVQKQASNSPKAFMPATTPTRHAVKCSPKSKNKPRDSTQHFSTSPTPTPTSKLQAPCDCTKWPGTCTSKKLPFRFQNQMTNSSWSSLNSEPKEFGKPPTKQ